MKRILSGRIIRHSLVIIGCGRAAWNLTSWNRDVFSTIQGTGTKGKPGWIDGPAMLSGLVLRAFYWVINYRLIPN